MNLMTKDLWYGLDVSLSFLIFVLYQITTCHCVTKAFLRYFDVHKNVVFLVGGNGAGEDQHILKYVLNIEDDGEDHQAKGHDRRLLGALKRIGGLFWFMVGHFDRVYGCNIIYRKDTLITVNTLQWLRISLIRCVSHDDIKRQPNLHLFFLIRTPFIRTSRLKSQKK